MSCTFEVVLPRPAWVGWRCFCCCCVFAWVVGLGLCAAATVCEALALASPNAASRASFASQKLVQYSWYMYGDAEEV